MFSKSDFSNIVIIEANLTNIGALAIERRMIRWYGRIDNNTGILHNKTDGGDENTGWIPSNEVKKNISKGNMGKKRSEDDREKMSIARSGSGHWNYNKKTSIETRRKISEGVLKYNESRILPVKTYTLVDLIKNIEIPFNCHNADEILTLLGVNKNSLMWEKRYNKNGVYKKRYTVR